MTTLRAVEPRYVTYKVWLADGRYVQWRHTLEWRPEAPGALLEEMEIDKRGLTVQEVWYPAHVIQRITWE